MIICHFYFATLKKQFFLKSGIIHQK